jgi:hypothetical protein
MARTCFARLFLFVIEALASILILPIFSFPQQAPVLVTQLANFRETLVHWCDSHTVVGEIPIFLPLA